MPSESTLQVSYEVYVLERGRWRAHFAGVDKAEAEKEVEVAIRRGRPEAVRLVREIHDPRSGQSLSHVLVEQTPARVARKGKVAARIG